jgi:hypothetical protein
MPRDANELAQESDGCNRARAKRTDLKAKFRQSMNEGMDNAAKNMPKNHDESAQSYQSLLLLLFEVYDNILMWAHYAKDHTGAVMEFSYIRSWTAPGEHKPVRYRRKCRTWSMKKNS